MGEHGFRKILEALLFSSDKPLAVEEMHQAFAEPVEAGDLRSTLESLKSEYESSERGFKLVEIAGGWQFLTDPACADYLRRFHETSQKRRLSNASLETLSVIAYRQPVARAEIEYIRGVNVDGAIKSLLEKHLVRVSGRKEAPGRPMLYATTREFLEYFGLQSLKDLPTLKEFKESDLGGHLVPPELKSTAVES